METFTFDNATMYRDAMFGVSRTDCRTITITTGVKYAQYDDAVKVVYTEKGKRTPRGTVLCGAELWIRVVATKDAISPDSGMVPNGDGSRTSRYTSCDPRYRTDFEDKLDASHVTPLISIGIGDREGAHLERCLAMDEKR